MAYKTRYNARYKNYEIQIQKNGYTGSSSVITFLGPNPLELSYAGNKGERKYVQGSSLTFSFYERPGENYNELFESNYKDYKLLLRNYDASTLIWQGYIKPENLSESYLDYNKLIELNATDAIADLKDIPFEKISKRSSILNVIKGALDNTGIVLPIQVQLHTWETTYMSPSECALQKAFIDTRKFKKDSNGKTEYDDCYTVLEKILQPFSCNLRQSNGAYRITNPNEIESNVFVYDFSTLSFTANVSSNNTINIDNYKFHPSSNKTKIRPLRAVNLTFNNKDVGEDLVNDVSNWTNTLVWRISSSGWSTTGEVLNLTLTNGQDSSIGLVNPFNVNYISGNEYMSLTFDYMADIVAPGYEYTDGDDIYLRIWLKEAAGNWVLVDDRPISRSIFYQSYESQPNSDWKIPGDTTFQLYLEWYAPTNLSTAYVHIKNFSLTQANYVDGKITDAVTFDKNFYGDIVLNKDILNDTIYFGDSDSITEISAITIGNLNLSTKWCLYNSDSSAQLQNLYTKQLLKNNARFRDYISIDVIDPSNTILPSSILQIGSKKFTITDYYRDYDENYVKLSLDELLTQDTSYYVYTQTQLTSIDGVNQSNSTTVVPSVGDHGALSGLGDDDHPQYLNTTRGDARYVTTSAINRLDASIVRIDSSLNNSFNIESYIEGSVYFTNKLKNIFIPEVSLNDSYFKWNSGLLEPSVAGGSGDVTKSYVDGSLALRDSSLNNTWAVQSYVNSSTYYDSSLNAKHPFSYYDAGSNATSLSFGSYTTIKNTVSSSITVTTSVPSAGIGCHLLVYTSGSTSRTITFSTGFKATGTLSTGTTSGKMFVIHWISDGTYLWESGRTTAI